MVYRLWLFRDHLSLNVTVLHGFFLSYFFYPLTALLWLACYLRATTDFDSQLVRLRRSRVDEDWVKRLELLNLRAAFGDILVSVLLRLLFNCVVVAVNATLPKRRGDLWSGCCCCFGCCDCHSVAEDEQGRILSCCCCLGAVFC